MLSVQRDEQPGGGGGHDTGIVRKNGSELLSRHVWVGKGVKGATPSCVCVRACVFVCGFAVGRLVE